MLWRELNYFWIFYTLLQNRRFCSKASLESKKKKPCLTLYELVFIAAVVADILFDYLIVHLLFRVRRAHVNPPFLRTKKKWETIFWFSCHHSSVCMLLNHVGLYKPSHNEHVKERRKNTNEIRITWNKAMQFVVREKKRGRE